MKNLAFLISWSATLLYLLGTVTSSPVYQLTDLEDISFNSSSAFFRPTWIQVQLDPIQRNAQKIKQFIGDDVHLMAVVKTDANGYGVREVAEVCISAGATWLGVATLDEALFLRSVLKDFIPILVVGYSDPKDLSVASRHKITVTAVSLEWIQKAAEIAREPFDFHLKLDTGMNRLGCKTLDEVRAVTKIVSQNEFLNWTGAFTHFATADDLGDEDIYYYHKQLELFDEFLKVIPQTENKIIHCANSAATLIQSHKPFFDMVRIGRALYGNIEPHLIPIQLERVYIELYSTLILVKRLEVGERVGYGGTFVATQRQWVGTVPIGYAEGFHAKLSNSFVLVDGIRVPIIGVVSMDQLSVALPKKYPVGTLVTFIAKEANETQRPPYEQFPSSTNRVPRLYFVNGTVASIRNPLLESIKLTESINDNFKKYD